MLVLDDTLVEGRPKCRTSTTEIILLDYSRRSNFAVLISKDKLLMIP
jgi:hypothetical protein